MADTAKADDPGPKDGGHEPENGAAVAEEATGGPGLQDAEEPLAQATAEEAKENGEEEEDDDDDEAQGAQQDAQTSDDQPTGAKADGGEEGDDSNADSAEAEAEAAARDESGVGAAGPGDDADDRADDYAAPSGARADEQDSQAENELAQHELDQEPHKQEQPPLHNEPVLKPGHELEEEQSEAQAAVTEEKQAREEVASAPRRSARAQKPIPAAIAPEPESPPAEETAPTRRRARKRSAPCDEVASEAFAESLLRTALWTSNGGKRFPGERNRVILVVGEKDKTRDALSVASGILQAASHTGAIIVDRAGPSSLFDGIRVGRNNLPDIVGVGSSSVSLMSEQHRVTVATSDCMDDAAGDLANAKVSLARNLAGPYRVAVVYVASTLTEEHEAVLRAVAAEGWPVLSTLDCPRPAHELAKFAAFPNPTKGNESGFASFLHVHMTVDLFAFG